MKTPASSQPAPRPLCTVYAPLLARLHSDTLDPDEEQAMRQHLDACSWCQAKLATFDFVDGGLRRHFSQAPGAQLPPSLEAIMAASDDTASTQSASISDITALFTRPPRRRWPIITAGVAAVLLLAVLVTGIALKQSGTHPGRQTNAARFYLTTYRLPSQNSLAESLAPGPDGNVWFTDTGANSVGYITPAGVIREFALPTPHSSLRSLAVGGDGALWFAEYLYGNAQQTDSVFTIGRVTLSGVVTEAPVPAALKNKGINGITPSRDGRLWFTYDVAPPGVGGGEGVGYIGTGGQWVLKPLAGPGMLTSAPAVGPDGSVWFAEQTYTAKPDGSYALSASAFMRLASDGKITRFPLATTNDSNIRVLVAGPDGNIWYTQTFSSASGAPDEIGSITPTGIITLYPLPEPAEPFPLYLAVGPDHNLWTVDATNKQLVRMTPQGQVTTFSLADGPALTGVIASSGDSLWFSTKTGVIDRYTP